MNKEEVRPQRIKQYQANLRLNTQPVKQFKELRIIILPPLPLILHHRNRLLLQYP